VDFCSTTPDTFSPVQGLKKSKGKVFEDLSGAGLKLGVVGAIVAAGSPLHEDKSTGTATITAKEDRLTKRMATSGGLGKGKRVTIWFEYSR
jgi:hypothetical protein